MLVVPDPFKPTLSNWSLSFNQSITISQDNVSVNSFIHRLINRKGAVYSAPFFLPNNQQITP